MLFFEKITHDNKADENKILSYKYAATTAA
jgi:hypothetical protein